MKVLFYIVAGLLILCFVSSFINSINTSRKDERYVDLTVGSIIFVMFLLLLKIFNDVGVI